MKLIANKLIDKKKFDKLKQLDRIEFKQKYDAIEKSFDRSFGFSFMKCLIIIFGISILLIPQAITAFGIDMSSDIIGFINVVIALFVLGMVVGFMVDIVLLIFKKKMLNELIESYFDFKVEVKK